MTKQTVAIAANFTIEPISKTLTQYFTKLGIDHEVKFAPFDQVFQQLIGPTSDFRLNIAGVNAIFIRLEDLFTGAERGSDSYQEGRANVEELKAALASAEDFKVPLLMFVCAPSENASRDSGLTYELESSEKMLEAFAETSPNLYIFGSQAPLTRYGVCRHDNPIGDSLARIPYTDQYYAVLGAELARKSDAVFRKPHKVLVLDCDNTLWDGICGEDGTDGVAFPEHRIALQRFAVEQSRAGMIVCLCSKNNEPDVWEVFDRRTEMPLRREHLVASKINWEPKSVNLRSLADELQLGLDSFIFVDDDAAVCAEVRENCPEVFTLLLPKETQKIPELLKHTWLFDRLKITNEDKDRSESYQLEVARRSVQRESRDLESFLQSLQLVCEIEEMRPEQVARVSQLSLRTNQFNSTTKRRSEADVKQISAEANKQVLTVSVRDRFGDYGLVGAVTCESNANSLYVDSFMLSCRALGRGVEHRILKHLGSIAVSDRCDHIDIEFVRSEKNAPIHNFLSEFSEATHSLDGNRSVYRVGSRAALSAKPREKAIVEKAAAEASTVVETARAAVDWQVYSDIAFELIDGMRTVPESELTAVNRHVLSSPFLEPRSETERSMLHIWESQLRLSGIGVLDNFFEIGGDSLLGVSVFVEIEEVFKRTLPLSVLISSPTIAGLSAHIEGERPTASTLKYLVPLQETGDRRPLFCMHAAGGNVLFYRDLAKELGGDQAVYGLQARGVADKNETAHDRVEDMAAAYLGEIRSVQPTGPYRLCGSSFGGLVAFEIARQLATIGERVELLAMFDTYAPGFLDTLEGSKASPIESLLLRFANIRGQLSEIGSARERIEFIAKRLLKIKNKIRRKVTWKKNQFALQYAKATGNELPRDIQRNHKAIDKALKGYIPHGVYEGGLVLFRAEKRPAGISPDSKLGWEMFTDGPIIAVDVKGSHGALTVYPFATDLAAKLRPFLSEIESAIAAGSQFAKAIAA